MNEGTGKLRYVGDGGDLFKLMIGNLLLTIVTFGIYTFWARTKERVFHFSHTDFGGDRFAYHGTGEELFRGYLKAVAVVAVLAIAFGIVTAATGGEDASVWVQFSLTAAFYAGLLALFVFAVNGTRRYRMSRSSWRGIRFAYDSDAVDFATMLIKGAALSVITLGIYTPAFQNERRAWLVSHARFGTERFAYDGPAEPLVIAFIKSLLLTIPTFGLCWTWYSAFRHRHFWSHTSVGGVRFESSVSGMDLFSLQITNFALAIMTLGIATPWIIVRTQQFYCDRVQLAGAVDWAAIRQRADAAGATAEGIADSMDVDVGLEM